MIYNRPNKTITKTLNKPNSSDEADSVTQISACEQKLNTGGLIFQFQRCVGGWGCTLCTLCSNSSAKQLV